MPASVHWRSLPPAVEMAFEPPNPWSQNCVVASSLALAGDGTPQTAIRS
jgi:hypothetical protein